MTARFYVGDARDVLQALSPESVQVCVTSPPYYGMRDYGADGQIGQEGGIDQYVCALVDVFRGVRRVLRENGTLWLNLGDSYKTSATPVAGLKAKNLVGVPWRVAFALQADGWYLRSDIIWSKPNPMPENVRDRPTRSHEYIFLLTRQPHYFFDTEAAKEPAVEPDRIRYDRIGGATGHTVRHSPGGMMGASATRNMRSVWTINTAPFAGAHFSTFPPRLAERCITAGSRAGDTVLDPFGGAGTVSLVCERIGRDSIYIDLNDDYAMMAQRRIAADKKGTR